MTYRDRVEYRPPPARIARINRLVARLALVGLTPRNTISLEVRGRRTGKLRRTALVCAEHEGSRYLVSLPGEAAWVRNEYAGGSVWMDGVTPAATLEELREIAPRYPVFRIVEEHRTAGAVRR